MKKRSATPAVVPIAIRRATLDDSADLLRLICAYYRFDHIRFHRPSITAGLRKLLSRGAHGRVWIMRDGAKAIGYIVLTFNFDLEFDGLEGLVTDLFVAQKYRGQGLGKRALGLVDDYCRSHGITTIELQVEQGNLDAQKFYRKIGFTQLSRIVMTRAVRPAA